MSALALLSIFGRHLVTFAASALVVAYAYRRGTRQRQRIEDKLTTCLPRPGRRHVFIRGEGVACPVCHALVPYYNVTVMLPPGREGFGDHVLQEHPESDIAADVRFLRATAWKSQSMS